MGDWTILDNLKYTESDEWVMVNGDTAKIGLTDYAQDQLSNIVFVDLSEVEVGGTVTRGRFRRLLAGQRQSPGGERGARQRAGSHQ
jgi:hypothetical protein